MINEISYTYISVQYNSIQDKRYNNQNIIFFKIHHPNFISFEIKKLLL